MLRVQHGESLIFLFLSRVLDSSFMFFFAWRVENSYYADGKVEGALKNYIQVRTDEYFVDACLFEIWNADVLAHLLLFLDLLQRWPFE